MTEKHKEIKENQESKKVEIKKEYKDIDYSLVSAGPLAIPEDLKQPGYVYQWVGDEARQIYTYNRFGYEVVHIDEIPQWGHNVPSRATNYSDAVTVQSKDGVLLVLMKIPTELHEKMMKYRHDQVRKTEEAIGKPEHIPEAYRIGEVTYKNKH